MVGIVFWTVRRCRHLIVRQYFRGPLLLVPFVLVTFGQSILALHQAEPESAFIPNAHQNIRFTENTHVMPVVWVIFDELDYGLAFERRPKGLLLPELDKLQQTSVSATDAYSPFSATAVSIPALLTGKMLKETKTCSAGVMTLTGTDGTTSSLQTEETIFGDMHKRGSRTALFGWAFPYSRLFSTIDDIKDYPIFSYMTSERLVKTVFSQLRTLVEAGYFSPFGDSLPIRHHISITTSMHNDVIHYLQTNQKGFAFLHYPVPHGPNIYSRHTYHYGTNRNVKEGYLDNLVLVDRLLGDVHRTMEKTGNWDKTMVIVSADHSCRVNTYDGIVEKRRVPFIAKLPHQVKGIIVNERFETVRTKDLILQIVGGKLLTPEDVVHWMKHT
jgi:hypothetical protein